MLISIEDAADPRIEPYRAVRERDLAGRQGRFVAEGEVVLRVLLSRSRMAVESLLVSTKRAPALAALLQTVPDAVPVYMAPQTVMAAIVGFPIHRGVLAIGRRPDPASPAALLRKLPDRATALGLIGLANHDNVGGIFRNAAAFGADLVLLDETSCDPLYRKAIRVSVGGSLIVPFARGGTGAGITDELLAAGFDVLGLSPGGSETIGGTPRAPRTAILLGAEGAGVPADILGRVRTVRIPMAPGFDSLNVATASGIALHRLMQPAHGEALALPASAD